MTSFSRARSPRRRIYAAGSFEEATARLQVLETEATAGGLRGQVRALRELQLEVIRELLGRGSSLLPVLHVHTLAGIAYRDGNHFWLMAQSHLFLREMVRGWISLEDSEEARRLGALALVVAGSAGPALEIDPANALALLLRAREEERLGHLEAAAARLERLLAVLPEDPHARLRLGLILKRLGRTGEASELLAAVTAGEAPGWIASVAVQELARLEQQAGRGARAEALMRRGVEELGDQTLYLQLAHHLDRNLRQVEAVALLSRMPLAGAGSPTAPRHRYSTTPEEEIGAAREELAEEARSRLPSLQAALEEGSTPPADST